MRSIGELARDSGLTVSALRFYDGAGVFGPAWVDPRRGYRWYGTGQLADARLLCRLRRLGLPLAQIRLVLAAEPGSGQAHRVLDAHLRRLQDGLADARRELSAVRALLDRRETRMTTTGTTAATTAGNAATTLALDAAELAAALGSVRFAAAADRPELPAPGGVLFDADPDDEGSPVLRLVATDRHRLAHARVAVRTLTGPAAGTVVPVPVVDGMRALLSGGGTAELTLDAAGVTLESVGRTVAGPGADGRFPDYRSLVRIDAVATARFAGDTLRAAVLAAGGRACGGRDTVVLTHDGGRAAVCPGEPGPGSPRIVVSRRYLLDALQAVPARQLVLELTGPTTPLAIRDADRPDRFSVLMPIA